MEVVLIGGPGTDKTHLATGDGGVGDRDQRQAVRF